MFIGSPCLPFFAGWEKKILIPLGITLPPVRKSDVIEYDEQWSFVHDKKNKKWLWLATLRRTGHTVAYHIGDRDHIAFQQLYNKVPMPFKKCQSRSDFWEAYDALPKRIHKKCGKEEGETSQAEAVNNVLRQRIGRLVRKTCSFSKSLENHNKVIGLFLQERNLELLSVK